MRPITFFTAVLTALALGACHASVPMVKQHQPDASRTTAQAVPVTLKIGGFQQKTEGAAFGLQTVPTYEITKARVEVTGEGMSLVTATASIEAGVGVVKIQVPMGKNRVFKAFGLRDNDSEVPGALVGAVKTIEPGDNDVFLNWLSTPVAEVFTYFLTKNYTERALETSPSSVQSLVNNMMIVGDNTYVAPFKMHASLIDGEVIGQQIQTNGGAIPGVSPSFVKAWGKVNVVVNGLDDAFTYDAWVSDPASELKTDLPGGVTQTLAPVRAGSWKLHIVIKDADKVAWKRFEQEIALADKQTRTVTLDLAGPTYANIDFNSHVGETFPDLSVPELEEGEYLVTVN